MTTAAGNDERSSKHTPRGRHFSFRCCTQRRARSGAAAQRAPQTYSQPLFCTLIVYLRFVVILPAALLPRHGWAWRTPDAGEGGYRCGPQPVLAPLRTYHPFLTCGRRERRLPATYAVTRDYTVRSRGGAHASHASAYAYAEPFDLQLPEKGGEPFRLHCVTPTTTVRGAASPAGRRHARGGREPSLRARWTTAARWWYGGDVVMLAVSTRSFFTFISPSNTDSAVLYLSAILPIINILVGGLPTIASSSFPVGRRRRGAFRFALAGVCRVQPKRTTTRERLACAAIRAFVPPIVAYACACSGI